MNWHDRYLLQVMCLMLNMTNIGDSSISRYNTLCTFNSV